MEPPASARVIVGLSGGVDSAVAALLLKEQGHDVQGLFMSNWDDEDDSYCTAAQDFQDARAVASELSIPLHRVSFAKQYRERVFEYFLREQRAGRTPNPDVLCNREIKFGVALQYVHRLGGSHFATGHYARLVSNANGATELHKMTVARRTLREYQPVTTPFPSQHIPTRRAEAQARLAERLERAAAEF